MNEIEFVVPGKPQGKARARTFFSPKRGKSISVTPENTVLYENLIKDRCIANMEEDGLHRFPDDVPLTLIITAMFEPAKSISKRLQQKMLTGDISPTKKPDTDNIIKVVADALNGVAYADDKQVVQVIAKKIYSNEAGLLVTVGEYGRK